MPVNDAADLHDAFWQALQNKDFISAEEHWRAGADLEGTNMRSETAFRFFAGNNDLDVAEWLVERGASIDAVDAKGDSALIRAVERKNLDQFNWIMDLGPDLDLRNGRGVTALMQACNQKIDEMTPFVQRLLDEGASPNSQSFLGGSPLLNAVARGDRAIVALLLDADADMRIVDPEGMSVLHIALRNEDKKAETLELLLDYATGVLPVKPEAINPAALGAPGTPTTGTAPTSPPDPLGLDLSGMEALLTPDQGQDPLGLGMSAIDPMILHMQVLHDLAEARRKLEQKLDINHKAKSGATPMSLASDRGSFIAMARLMALGADVNVRSSLNGDRTPLMVMLIADEGQPLVIPALELGADVNARDAEGNSVLFYASQKVNPTLIAALVAAGCDVQSVTGPSGFTPLHGVMAIDKDEVRLAALDELLNLGLPVDPPFGKGGKTDGNDVAAFTTPLSWALMKRDVEAVKMLIDAQADVNRQDPTALAPLHHLAKVGATAHEQYAMRKIAQTKGVTQEALDAQADLLNTMIKKGCADLMDALVSAGADINAPGKEGSTPIMEYVAAKRADLVEHALVQHQADPLKTDEYGDHALTVALKSGNPLLFQELVFELETAGRGQELASVLLDAVYSSPEGWEARRAFVSTIKLCGQKEAWINAVDDEGNTPLIVAAATNQPDVIDALLAMGAPVNTVNHKGETALMHGTLSSNTEIIYALRRAGADVSMRTHDKRDAFTIAQQMQAVHATRALRDTIPEYENLNPEPSMVLPPPGRLFRQAPPPVAPVDEAAAIASEAEAPLEEEAPAPRRPRMR